MWAMKWTVGLALMVAVAMPVHAGLVYDNGPINGAGGAYTINLGASVSNSFTVSSATNLTSATAGIWVTTGDTPISVEWSIGTSAFGSDVSYGTSLLSNTYFITNGGGYDVYSSSFSLTGAAGAGTYYLTLQNAVSTNSNYVFWDVNSGSSTAYQNGIGNPIPSESFQLFDDGTPAVPEPASMAIWGLGALGCAAAGYRRRRSPR